MTINTQLTKKETSVIVGMVENDYTAGDTDSSVNSGTWVFAISQYYEFDGFDVKGLGGVVASLVKKGLVWTQDGVEPDENICGLTEKGLNVFKELDIG